MGRTVDIYPAHTPTSQSGYGVEWAVATPSADGGWERSDAMSEVEARCGAESHPNAVVIAREVLGWRHAPGYEAPAEYDGSMDAIVEQIIAAEHEVVRGNLSRGADLAVTHMESPSRRMVHRVSCASLEDQFDRDRVWNKGFRERLREDRSFRLSLPSLITRAEARALINPRSCKVCWPNIGGDELPPTRTLKAEGLRAHHIGRTLLDQDGADLGTVSEVTITRSTGSLGEDRSESVTVVTDRTRMDFKADARVQILSIVETPAAAARDRIIRQRVGLE